MAFKWLKWLRVAVSLGFLLLITFAFIDFTNTLTSEWYNGILYFQFVPSVLKFLSLLGLLTTGFIIVLILTVLFGRVYCSALCPLGTFQDLFIYIAGKFKKIKHLSKFAKAQNWFRYSVLTLVIIFLVFGNILMLNLLDPYSIYGKMASSLFRPLYYFSNNILVYFMEKRLNFTFYHVDLKNISWLTFAFSSLMFLFIGGMAVTRGRLYCNTICPVGSLLGLVSKYSIFKIKLNKVACTSCGICGYVCKADCIDTLNKEVDFSRCVGCFNCLTVCPGGGVEYNFSWRKDVSEIENIKAQEARRDFLKKSAFITTGITLLTKRAYTEGLNDGKIPVVKEHPVVPPGSISIDHFVDNCTACQLCVSACPTQVLQPSFMQYGLRGMMQPTMDYNTNYCNFECILCCDICPTAAILPITVDDKKLTQLGKAKFIKENCIVYTDETACGACSEHCPTKAVNMIPYTESKEDNLTIPEVDDTICIGCGACEYACPTDPKSIYVDGNPEHIFAEKPEEKQVEESKQTIDDFPF